MAINKVIYDGETLIDLTGDTVSESTLVKGTTAHNAAGESITGTAEFYKIGHGLKVEEENTLCVDAVSDFKGDNTLPITAAAVQETVGNIEILLATI